MLLIRETDGRLFQLPAWRDRHWGQTPCPSSFWIRSSARRAFGECLGSKRR